MLPVLTKLAQYLLGYDTVAVAPIVQPHVASVPGVFYDQGAMAIPPITENGFTMEVLTVAPVGFAQPDPVFVYGTPPADFVPGSTSGIAETNAQGGSC